MLLNKVPLGTPSTPIRSTLSPKSVTPSTPQRVNRFINKLQVKANAFMSSSPRRDNHPRVVTPIRPNVSQRVPLRQLYAQPTLPVVPSPKRAHISNPNEENHRVGKRFDRNSFTVKACQSILNMNRRRDTSIDKCIPYVRPKSLSPKPILQGMNVYKILCETEPMDCEITAGGQYILNNMSNANDSMEIDADDDICGMEVDAIVDMETLMDYIPMH